MDLTNMSMVDRFVRKLCRACAVTQFPCPDGCNESDPSDREQGIPLLTGLREKLTSFGNSLEPRRPQRNLPT
ncbi:hypothetical protein CEXT_389861 [Caerostris extrusa]|uniref:Uncharacterized protein n=1 Tax=Caerostris extrusa TaxID=172846 RepID=A0AAV4V916_CAEEX|nr:hypothetical protein CEXT_389861 [Caerostris extrusa]